MKFYIERAHYDFDKIDKMLEIYPCLKKYRIWY